MKRTQQVKHVYCKLCSCNLLLLVRNRKKWLL